MALRYPSVSIEPTVSKEESERLERRILLKKFIEVNLPPSHSYTNRQISAVFHLLDLQNDIPIEYYNGNDPYIRIMRRYERILARSIELQDWAGIGEILTDISEIIDQKLYAVVEGGVVSPAVKLSNNLSVVVKHDLNQGTNPSVIVDDGKNSLTVTDISVSVKVRYRSADGMSRTDKVEHIVFEK